MPFRYGRWCKQKLFGMTNIELEEEEEEKELAIAQFSTTHSSILYEIWPNLGKCVQKIFGLANIGAFGGQFSCPLDMVGGVNRSFSE